MSYIVIDVEADGPVPHLYSMVSFGAVIVDQCLDKTFKGEVAPISSEWIPRALSVSNISRETHLSFRDPEVVMLEFKEWIEKNSVGSPVFISDNPAFDWQWINYYFHRFVGENPFGFSARRIGDLYCGMVKDAGKNAEWKRLYRKTVHDHTPVNDAKGNAEALHRGDRNNHTFFTWLVRQHSFSGVRIIYLPGKDGFAGTFFFQRW